MRIATFVQAELHDRLERSVNWDDSLLHAESWPVLTKIVRQQRVDIAVIDPFARRRDDVRQITRFSCHFPDLPILIYTVVGPSTAGSILALNNVSINHVCLHPFEGTPRDFREAMTNAIEDTLSSHFIKGLTEIIELLPINLRRGVERMLARPEQFRSAGDLALHAEVAPLQMYRHFEFAGLSSPKRLLIVARLLRFYAHTKYAGMTAKLAATRLGYPDCRVLSRYSQNSLGIALPKLSDVAEARLLTQLTRMVTRA